MQRIACFAVCDVTTLVCFGLCWVQRSVWGGWFMRTPAGPCLPHKFNILHPDFPKHFLQPRSRGHKLDSNPGAPALIPFGGCVDVCMQLQIACNDNRFCGLVLRTLGCK